MPLNTQTPTPSTQNQIGFFSRYKNDMLTPRFCGAEQKKQNKEIIYILQCFNTTKQNQFVQKIFEIRYDFNTMNTEEDQAFLITANDETSITQILDIITGQYSNAKNRLQENPSMEDHEIKIWINPTNKTQLAILISNSKKNNPPSKEEIITIAEKQNHVLDFRVDTTNQPLTVSTPKY